MQQYKQHPLGKVFPPLGMPQISELKSDILANGLRNPITLYEGKILDGWNRYRACTSSGVLPTMTEFKGDDPVLFVISQNLYRRHLSTGAKLELAKKLLAEESKRAAARMKAGKTLPPTGGRVAPKSSERRGTAASKVAKAVGVSARSVERSIKIDKTAIPEIKAAVSSGKMSIRKAERVSKLPKREQKRIAKDPEKEEVKEDNYDLGVLKRTWARADKDTQKEFLDWIKTI